MLSTFTLAPKLLKLAPKTLSKLPFTFRTFHTSSSAMPAFTLYGALGSTNTDRVRLTLAQGGITDYDYVPLNLAKGEQKSPEHMARHPWGKIPVAVWEDGFTLYESRAICRYIALKHALPLLPPASDAKAAALFEQALSSETLYFAEPAGRIGYEKFVKPFRGLPADEAVVAAALKEVEAYFDVADKLLQKTQFMAGDELSLVDIYYIPLVKRLFAVGFGETVLSRPNVAAWWHRATNMPEIKKLLDADQAAMAAAMAARKN